jgi:hypothetical protein
MGATRGGTAGVLGGAGAAQARYVRVQGQAVGGPDDEAGDAQDETSLARSLAPEEDAYSPGSDAATPGTPPL